MSDSDTTDSDCGVRFKTTSTRHKMTSSPVDRYTSSSRSNQSYAGRSHRDSSANHRDSGDRRRGRSSERYRDRRRSRSRSRSRDRRKYSDRRSSRRRSRTRSRSGSRSKKSSATTSPTPNVSKVLDISVSSLSSQDDHHEGEDKEPLEQISPEVTVPEEVEVITEAPKTIAQDEDPDTIGPALPPHLLQREQKPERPSTDTVRIVGPTLPPGFVIGDQSAVHETSDSELSPFSEPDEAAGEEDFVGPMPGSSHSRANLELEQRALELKIRRLESGAEEGVGTVIPKAREDWMLELPDVRKISDMGLGARQFRTREKLEMGDRSVWTDTPEDRERRAAGLGSKKASDPSKEREQERERKETAKRDREQEEMVKKHKKKNKRDKALLDLHQSKLKKDQKEKSKDSEPTRRPFDRNVDLHANRFDDAQKKAIIKKAQLLDTRFSSGASKFL